jgi:hypothetical protein
MANLTAQSRNDAQPWNHYETRDEHGHPLQAGAAIGSRIYHPRMRGCLSGATLGRCYSYALACPLR